MEEELNPWRCPVADSSGDHNLDEDDLGILDIGGLDNEESWISNSLPSGQMEDLRSWLRADQLNSADSPDDYHLKKSIDSRTFTRPKRRSSNRLIDKIADVMTPPEQKAPVAFAQGFMETGVQPLEEIPSMLRISSRPGFLVNSGSLTMTISSPKQITESWSNSGQESMEAFLNKSQSKGIDSFINLSEPESLASESLMNVSQPSVFYSSILSLPSVEDDSRPQLATKNSTMEMSDSQILTESMMQTSMFEKEVDLVCLNDTFARNDTMVLNSDATFTEESMTYGIVMNLQSETCATSSPLESEEHFSNPFSANNSDSSLNRTITNDLQTSIITSSNLADGTFLKDVNVKNLDVTVDRNGTFCKSPMLSKNALNSTFQTSPSQLNDNNIFNVTYDAQANLRQELLKQVEKSAEKNPLNVTHDVQVDLDTTYNCILGKEETAEQVNHATEDKQLNLTFDHSKNRQLPLNPNAANENKQKYNTITKSKPTLQLKENLMENEVKNPEMQENINATFCKPAQRKLVAPRQLSRLPQFLQKSNPNLITNSSELKTGKLSMPGNAMGLQRQTLSMANSRRTLSLATVKSGSEQRLNKIEATKNSVEFSSSRGSTESIESTQSAHSAPDLDDGLSICSDSSHSSYKNADDERLRKILLMQEENLKKESTPKPDRNRRETIVISKNMPSPILKAREIGKSDPALLQSLQSTLKSSSPFISPEGSTQSLDSLEMVGTTKANMIRPKSPIMRIEKSPLDNDNLKKLHGQEEKTSSGAESKPKLKPPTNWGSGRPSAVSSGIPRPMSRIPAPKFARPPAKGNR